MMFTPCWPRAGPTGGAGVAWPAVICSLMIAASFFFFGGISVLSLVVDVHPAEWRRPDACRFSREDRSDLGDLGERQLDRSFPTEDRHQHLELLPIRVDLADRGGQRGERTVHH